MSEYATKNNLNKALQEQSTKLEQFIDEKISNAVTDLSEIIANLAQSMHNEIVDLKVSHDRLLNTIDGFIGRIDTYETEQTARDAQFARLLEWAKEVSKKTGIPLKGF